jgi:regulatory protein
LAISGKLLSSFCEALARAGAFSFRFAAMLRRTFTKEQAYQKLRQYCAYQDRCHGEVKTKAYSLGIRKTGVDELTAKLIEEGCLNEERFAKNFAGGKFRIKQWGRIKIRAELKKKQVSNYCITADMEEIDDSKYKEVLHRMAVKKWNTIKGTGTNLFVKMTKTRNYLLQRGYEANLVAIEIKALAEKQKGAG